MSFLAPWAALAALAVGTPVILFFYLLKLRRRPVRVGSTMLWDSAVHDLQANIPFRWLRPSWLLALHLLVLALLAGALGRPILRAGSGEVNRLVILLDRSASMSAADSPNGSTRLDLGKARSLELIDQALSVGGTSVAVVAFGAEPTLLAGFTTGAATLRDAVRLTTPTDQPARLAEALKFVETLGTTPGEDGTPGRAITVALVSDGSFEPTDRYILGGGRVNYVRIVGSPTPPDNLGIVALSARRDYNDPARTSLFVRIVNSSTVARDATIALRLDAAVLERRPVRVPGRAADPAAAETNAGGDGETSLTLDLNSTQGGVVRVEIERPDALAADNAAALVLTPAPRPRVVLVNPDVPSEPPGSTPSNTDAPVSPPWLLEDALSELGVAQFRVITASEYERSSATSTIAADLIVFNRVTPTRTPPTPSLSFAASVPLPGLHLERSPSPDGTYVLAWSRAHPVLRDVALDSVFIAGPASLAWDARALDAETLASGRDGPLIVVVRDGTTRRVLVAFDPAWSNWPLQSGFPIFLAAAVDYLTLRGEQSAGRAFTTAQPVELSAPAGAPSVRLRGPTMVEAAPTPSDQSSAPRVSFGLLERAGVYDVDPPGSTPKIAVNLLDADESRLGSVADLTVGGREVLGDPGANLPREVWVWFVLASGILLVAEWFLFAARMRA